MFVRVSPYAGRTLDGMVDIFCALMENAISHSGLPIEALLVDFQMSLSDGRFVVAIENNGASSTPTDDETERLVSLRNDIVQNNSRRKAQVEGKSGFRKMWATINAPQYRESRLDFGFSSNGNFRVDISFDIENIDDEDTLN
ncbi:hypothetical protein [Paraburkholderia xenovorans]|jgi:hypothetical protein